MSSDVSKEIRIMESPSTSFDSGRHPNQPDPEVAVQEICLEDETGGGEATESVTEMPSFLPGRRPHEGHPRATCVRTKRSPAPVREGISDGAMQSTRIAADSRSVARPYKPTEGTSATGGILLVSRI